VVPIPVGALPWFARRLNTVNPLRSPFEYSGPGPPTGRSISESGDGSDILVHSALRAGKAESARNAACASCDRNERPSTRRDAPWDAPAARRRPRPAQRPRWRAVRVAGRPDGPVLRLRSEFFRIRPAPGGGAGPIARTKRKPGRRRGPATARRGAAGDRTTVTSGAVPPIRAGPAPRPGRAIGRTGPRRDKRPPGPPPHAPLRAARRPRAAAARPSQDPCGRLGSGRAGGPWRHGDPRRPRLPGPSQPTRRTGPGAGPGMAGSHGPAGVRAGVSDGRRRNVSTVLAGCRR
jgi:hypothetical protein